jgi:hypothetical protein
MFMSGTRGLSSTRFIAMLLALAMAIFPAVVFAAHHPCRGSADEFSFEAKSTCCARHQDQSEPKSEEPASHKDCGGNCLSMCCRAAVVAVTHVTFDFAHDAPPAAPVFQPELVPHTAESCGGIFHPPRI